MRNLEGQSWKVEDAERVKEWYWEKLVIVAFSTITCVGTEKNVIPDNTLWWLFSKKKKSQTDQHQFFL